MKNGHLTDSDIIETLCEISDEKRKAAVMNHISRCEPCRRDYEAFSRSLSPDRNAGMPGRHVREAILAEIPEKSGAESRNKGFLFYRLAAASLAFIIPAAAYMIYSYRLPVKPAEFAVNHMEGDIRLNGVPVSGDVPVPGKSVIESGLQSQALLSDGKTLFTNIGPETRLEALSDIAGEKTSYVLERGSVIIRESAVSHHTIETAGYVIKPLGTEYFVSIKNDVVMAGVMDGSVSVKNRVTGSDFIIAKNYFWKSDGTGTSPLPEFFKERSFDAIAKLYQMPEVEKIQVKKEGRTVKQDHEKDAPVTPGKKDIIEKSESREEAREKREMRQDKQNHEREKKGRTDQERGQKRGRQ